MLIIVFDSPLENYRVPELITRAAKVLMESRAKYKRSNAITDSLIGDPMQLVARIKDLILLVARTVHSRKGIKGCW